MNRIAALTAVLVLICACGSATPTAPAAPSAGVTLPSGVPASVRPTPNAASPRPTSIQTPAPSADARTVGWRADIDQLLDRLSAMHPDFAQQVSLADLEQAANELRERVPSSTDDELLVGIMGLVAMVSAKGCDAHTGAYVWGGGNYVLESMPLRLWLFGDRVYIVDARPPYEELIGQFVVSMERVLMDDVVARVDGIVPRDNEQTVRLLMPRFLLIPQILSGLGIAHDGGVTLITEGADGAQTTTAIAPISMPAYNSWAGAYGLHLPADPDVLYLSRIDEVLWWETRPDGSLLVQYNQVQHPNTSELQAAVDEFTNHEIVLDLRHNFGGEVSAVDPMVSVFQSWLSADPANHLTVATGRNTFSAASLIVARLDALDDVDIVGEEMSGCPSGWGNSRDFNLAYSGIPISVATTFETGVTADDPRRTIVPDVPLELTIEDWLQKRDPVLDR